VVTLSVASTATVDLGTGGEAAAATGTLEEIVVHARRPVEVKTSEVGASVSLHQIETTPQITRNFLEFADTVPGMIFQVDAKGNTSIRSGPQSAGATNVYIDGIGQKNYVRSSGIAGQGGADPNQNPIGDPGNPFPQLAIGEYKVITSNYKAEYDQISGAAITAVTKSGTNELHGEAFGTYTNGSMRSETPAEKAAGTGKQGGPSKEYGFAVGGPIILDKLHYFVTYEGKQFTTPNTVHASPVQDDNHVDLPFLSWLPPDLLANYGPVANPFKEDLYFGKLDWELTDTDRLELTAKYRRERQQAGAAGVVAESAASTYVNDENRYQFRWEHTSGHFFNEVTLASEKTTDSPSKSSNNPGKRYEVLGAAGFGFDTILQTDGVDPRSYFFTAQKGWSLQDDLTISNIPWHGSHNFKTGIKVKDVKLQDRDAGTAPLYDYYVGPTGVEATPFQVTFGAQADSNLPTVSSSKNRQFGVYFQDDWAASDRLLLNLGVRYDYEQTPTYTDFVTPQRFVSALNGIDTNNDPVAYFWDGAYHGAAPGQTYAQTLAKAGININDYISNGHNRSNPNGEIAPRLGFSFDLQGNQRHVIFGGAGRSYDRNVFGILQHESNKATLYVPSIGFHNDNSIVGCPTGAPDTPSCVTWNDSYLTQAGLQSIAPAPFGEMHLINNHLKAPYSDQFSVGIRNKLGQWNTSVSVVRVLSYNGVIANEANYFGDGTWWWFNTGPYAGYTGLVNTPNGGQALYLFDNAKATRTTQLLVSFEKPYTRESHWSATFAYTYSNAQEKLVATNGDYQFDFPHSSMAPFVTSSQVPKHRLVAAGSLDIPWGLILGAKLVLETPKPFTGFDQFVDVQENGLNYNYARISQFPKEKIGYKTLDLQLTKSIALPRNLSTELRVDVLNATNAKNYSQLFDGFPDRPYYFTDGDIAGVPRTLKVTLNFKF
jgi:outer membrane receptor protein involved in Fe transport